MVPFVRLLPVVVAAAATAAVTLHSLDLWDLTDGQVTAAVVALAAISIGESVLRLVAGVTARERLEQERRDNEALRGLLVRVVRASAADWTEVGVNAFLIRRRHRWFGRRRLERVGRERIRNAPASSDVEWTFGKGVIGRCWRYGVPMAVDLRDHFAGFEGCTREMWKGLTDDETLGMTYDDFHKTRQHAVVAATPIRDRTDRIIGVLSVDIAVGPLHAVVTPEVLEALAATAVTLRNLRE